jgi:APA family basic amino acid/polyamine antiporter
MAWPALIISLGAVFATTSVLLVFQLGQPRIFLSMARDGLLPKWAATVHPKFRTPSTATIVTGVLVAVLATMSDYGEIVQLTNIGTFFAFVLVCIGVIVLRRRDPGRARPFRVPGGDWLVPVLGAVSCGFLMFYLPGTSWWRFVGWLILGASVYCGYGWSGSAIGRRAGRPTTTPGFMRTMAAGFLAIAAGLFLVPHSSSLRAMLAEAATAGAEGRGRIVIGLTLVAIGLVLTVAGALAGRGWRRTLAQG